MTEPTLMPMDPIAAANAILTDVERLNLGEMALLIWGVTHDALFVIKSIDDKYNRYDTVFELSEDGKEMAQRIFEGEDFPELNQTYKEHLLAVFALSIKVPEINQLED